MNKVILANVIVKLDEIAADLREAGFMEGDASYDETLKLREQYCQDFEMWPPVSYRD